MKRFPALWPRTESRARFAIVRCNGASLQYAIQALCAFSTASGWRCNWPWSASTMTCYAPVFFLYFAMICLCSASMRLHVRWMRNQLEAVILPLRLQCAPPAGTVIIGPWATDGSPDPEHTSSAQWGARAADRPSTSSAWGVCCPVQHGRAGLPSAGDSRQCWGWSVCWVRFT